jgi:protein-S-isoprenylcysteine O-methyltransferase Ste14
LAALGAWLFRNRGWLPVPLVAAALAVPPRWPWAWLVAVPGLVLRAWAVAHVGRESRTRGILPPPLATTGPYAMTRNPLYLGNLLVYAALGLVHWPAAAVLLPLLAVHYAAIVRWEEGRLLEVHGERYAEYARISPRWWPRIAKLGAQARGRSFREIAQSERGTHLALALVLSLSLGQWYSQG